MEEMRCGIYRCYYRGHPRYFTYCVKCERNFCSDCKNPEKKMCNRCIFRKYEKKIAESMNNLSESKIFMRTTSRSNDIRGKFEGKYVVIYHLDESETCVYINGIHCYSIFPLKFEVVTPETVYQELVNAIKHYDVLGKEYKMIEMNKEIQLLQLRNSSTIEKIKDLQNDINAHNEEITEIKCERNKIS
jgi:hypothetical protein